MMPIAYYSLILQSVTSTATHDPPCVQVRLALYPGLNTHGSVTVSPTAVSGQLYEPNCSVMVFSGSQNCTTNAMCEVIMLTIILLPHLPVDRVLKLMVAVAVFPIQLLAVTV